jgi:outer membrane protein assembly factor BamB
VSRRQNRPRFARCRGFHKGDLGPINPKNSHASPTPVLDGERVYVHFGAHGTACLSSRGDILWRVDKLGYDHRHGPAGSPVVWRDYLIFNCDGADTQCVVALDKLSGEIRWRADREGRMGYSTPLLVSVGGVDQVISPGGGLVASYAAATGQEIWRLPLVGDSIVTRPVFGHGLLFVTSGYGSPALYAVRADSRGEIAATDAAWTLRRGIPNDPSPLLVGDELYILSDQGVTSCVDARTGTSHWQLRLSGAYSASPVVAEERIYFTNEEGLTTVMAAGKTPKKLATSQLEGRTLASLAIADRAIFLRTDKALYRIETNNASAEGAAPVAARSPSKR